MWRGGCGMGDEKGWGRGYFGGVREGVVDVRNWVWHASALKGRVI